MKFKFNKNLIAICVGGISFVASATSGAAIKTDSSEKLATSYLVEVIMSKDGKQLSYEKTTLNPLSGGEAASITSEDTVIPLQYTGMAESEITSKGKFVSYTLAYVTMSSEFIVDAYRKECGNIKLNSSWPPEQTEYQVQSYTKNCRLFVRINVNSVQ